MPMATTSSRPWKKSVSRAEVGRTARMQVSRKDSAGLIVPAIAQDSPMPLVCGDLIAIFARVFGGIHLLISRA